MLPSWDTVGRELWAVLCIGRLFWLVRILPLLALNKEKTENRLIQVPPAELFAFLELLG